MPSSLKFLILRQIFHGDLPVSPRHVPLLVSLSLCAAASLGQNQPLESDVIATVGPHTVSVRDVLDRIELMPWPGKDRPALRDSIAWRATVSLIAEKLLALKATSLGIGLDQENAARFASLERALARDQLYREEVSARVTISREEAGPAMKRFATELRLAVFPAKDEKDARSMARILTAGRPLPFAPAVTETVSVSFGELAQSHEDVAYALKRRFEARPSYSVSSGWLVLQLLDRRSNPESENLSVADRGIAAARLLRKRKQSALAASYVDRYGAGIPTHMDSLLFRAIADTLRGTMSRDAEGHRKGKAFGVNEGDVIRLWEVFRNDRGRSFITHGRDTVTVGDMINGMAFHPVQVRSLGRGVFLEDLNRGIITVAESELISSRAMKLGYNAREDVRRDLAAWVEAWQTQALAGRVGGDSLNAYIARLASEYGVWIDRAKIRELKFSPVNLVTRRMIGFGGSLPAVPILPEMWGWYHVWLESKRIAP